MTENTGNGSFADLIHQRNETHSPTGRRVRIESNLDTDKKTHALHHTKVTIDGTDVTNDVIAIDWHADARSIPTATIQLYAPALDAEATETTAPQPIHGEVLLVQDSLADEIAELKQAYREITQQLATLTQGQPLCATCTTEARAGTRPNINWLNVIIDGTGYCHDHTDTVNGRLVPKKTSGIIITGA